MSETSPRIQPETTITPAVKKPISNDTDMYKALDQQGDQRVNMAQKDAIKQEQVVIPTLVTKNPHEALQALVGMDQAPSDNHLSIGIYDTKSQHETTTNESSFPQSNEITKDEFDRLPRSAEFKFHFNQNGADLLTQFAIKGNRVQVAAELPFDARTMMPAENLAAFAVQKDGKKLIYPPAGQQDLKEQTEHSNESYYIDNLQPMKLEIDKAKIERMTPATVVDALHQVQGNELIFYTGAGISMGGEKPVWGMAQLKNELGLNDPDGLFLQTFANPDKYPPSELVRKVDEFRKQLFEDTSTPAHAGMADLVRKLPGAAIFTENIDLKHEAEGSRIRAVHTDSDVDAFTKLKSRAADTKILITAGLSKDDRAIIQYIKQQNPGVKIISFSLSDETIPDYLDEHDAVILGDMQKTLPEVAASFTSKGNEHPKQAQM